jgi:hypothetical protein
VSSLKTPRTGYNIGISPPILDRTRIHYARIGRSDNCLRSSVVIHRSHQSDLPFHLYATQSDQLCAHPISSLSRLIANSKPINSICSRNQKQSVRTNQPTYKAYPKIVTFGSLLFLTNTSKNRTIRTSSCQLAKLTA